MAALRGADVCEAARHAADEVLEDLRLVLGDRGQHLVNGHSWLAALDGREEHYARRVSDSFHARALCCVEK